MHSSPSPLRTASPRVPSPLRPRPSAGPGPRRGLWLALLALGVSAGLDAQTPLRERLQALPFKIAYESYVNQNWDLFVINADGSNPVNLTRTPQERELYPQVSHDGTRLAFVSDRGEGREAVRSVWVMDTDGRNRKKVSDYARQPFWSHDSREVGYLPQEYPKFNVIDFFTKGVAFYDLATGRTRFHSNTTNLHHLYNPHASPNGRWIVSTVHAGMGVDHGILLLAADGPTILNLKIPGCRPCLSPDGKQIAWGADDHTIAVAPLDTTAPVPTVGPWRLRIVDAKLKIYHVDWSPDGRFLCFSRGPDGEGDPSQPGTFHAACEIVGVHAPGWNLVAVSAERDGTLDLNSATDADYASLTSNGCSNKEPAWFAPPTAAR